MIFVTHFTAAVNFQFLHNRYIVKRKLHWYSGAVESHQRQRPTTKTKQWYGGAFVHKLPQSQPRSQDLYGGATKIPAKTLETRFCDNGIGFRRFEIRAGDVFFPLSNFRCWTTKVYGNSLTFMWVKWQYEIEIDEIRKKGLRPFTP